MGNRKAPAINNCGPPQTVLQLYCIELGLFHEAILL